MNKDELIEKLYHERNIANAQLDRLIAVMTYNGLCIDCGTRRDDCTEEECQKRQADIDNWIGDLDTMLAEVNCQ